MKTITKIFLLVCALTCCVQVQAQTKEQAQSDYQLPTFIGANIGEQQTLFKALSGKTELDQAKQRQLLLVELAILANSEDKTLAQLQQLEKRIQAYLKTDKNDAELSAAKGSAIALQSLFFEDNLGKMNFLSRKGMRMMDRAVKKQPNNLGARLLRGLSYANMPAFLNRASFAKDDLTLVKQHIPSQQNPGFIEFVDHYLAMATAKLEGETK